MSSQDPLAQAALSRQLTRPQLKIEGEASRLTSISMQGGAGKFCGGPYPRGVLQLANDSATPKETLQYIVCKQVWLMLDDTSLQVHARNAKCRQIPLTGAIHSAAAKAA